MAIYEPLIMHLLRRCGMQDSDARDVCQQVLQAVAKDVPRWRDDGRPASFRRWLNRIARHRMLKFLERERRHPRPAGGSTANVLLNQQPAESTAAWFDREYRHQLVLWAAEQIRGEFHEKTWLAFWRTCIEQQPIAETADKLEMSVGAVYVARSRVIARIRERVNVSSGSEESK